MALEPKSATAGDDVLRERPLHRPVFTDGWKAPVLTGELTFEEVCLKAREGVDPETLPEIPQLRHTRTRSTEASFVGAGTTYDPQYLAIAALTEPGTMDWPGHVASTVMLQGCPWRCTYCFSTDMQSPRVGGTVAWADVVSELESRRGTTDAVVFSGGEPTRQGALPEAMRVARAMGYKVGLLTAGGFPGRLVPALEHCDWVGIDIKATPDGYEAITRTGVSGQRAYESLEVVRDSGVEYEVRLTVDPVTHSHGDVLAAIAEIERRTGRAPVLQEVRPEGVSASYAAQLGDLCLADVLPADERPELVRR